MQRDWERKADVGNDTTRIIVCAYVRMCVCVYMLFAYVPAHAHAMKKHVRTNTRTHKHTIAISLLPPFPSRFKTKDHSDTFPVALFNRQTGALDRK